MKINNVEHNWTPSALNEKICHYCRRNYLAHQSYATCDACGKVGSVNLFGPVDNPKSMLLCPTCERKEIETAIVESKKDVELHGEARVLEHNASMLVRAREIDQSIRYNGDVFNAKTIALAE